MAMNYAWQERKKFAIPVAAGAAVLLIWYLFVLSGINAGADAAARDRRTAEMQLRNRMQAGVPQDDAVSRAERDRATLKKDLKEIQDKLAFRVDETFKAKEGQNLATKFGSARQIVYTKIDTARRGMNAPDSRLKFPQSVMSVPEPVLAEWLIRLAVVQRVYLLAIECNIGDFQLGETVPSEVQDEPTVPPDRFMGALSIKFKVMGTAESILKFYHGLQLEGPSYLTVEALDVTSADPTKSWLGASMTVGALIIRPDKDLPTEPKP